MGSQFGDPLGIISMDTFVNLLNARQILCVPLLLHSDITEIQNQFGFSWLEFIAVQQTFIEQLLGAKPCAGLWKSDKDRKPLIAEAQWNWRLSSVSQYSCPSGLFLLSAPFR